MEIPEIELTVDDIVQGTKHTKKLVLKSKNPSYNDKTVIYRSLTGNEFAQALEKSNVKRDQNPAESFRFLIEAGRLGVVTPGIGQKIGQLDEDIITQIGTAILGVTEVDTKKVEDFSEATKGK